MLKNEDNTGLDAVGLLCLIGIIAGSIPIGLVLVEINWLIALEIYKWFGQH